MRVTTLGATREDVGLGVARSTGPDADDAACKMHGLMLADVFGDGAR